MKLIPVACIGLALAGPAHAEFILRMPSPPAVAPAAAPAPSVVQPPARRPAPRPLPAAEGFGKAVPLSFAVRQIVPGGVDVSIGDGIDEAAPVDWSGGQPWNTVLADAIKPLGLKVTANAKRVSISR